MYWFEEYDKQALDRSSRPFNSRGACRRSLMKNMRRDTESAQALGTIVWLAEKATKKRAISLYEHNRQAIGRVRGWWVLMGGSTWPSWTERKPRSLCVESTRQVC